MAQQRRPNHIDLNARPFDPNRLGQPSPRDLPSPRSGEVPPALSPLDAFAFQGRMLARKFEEDNNGRRISRLPHVTVANEFGRGRPGYTSPPRPDEATANDRGEPQDPGASPEMTLPQFRPQSYYPSILSLEEASRQSTLLLSGGSALDTVSEDPERSNSVAATAAAMRSQSPEAIDEMPELETQARNHNVHAFMTDIHPRPFMPQKRPTNESEKSNSSANLAPPRSPAFPRSPRLPPAPLRSPRLDSGDDTDNLSVNGDVLDPRRGDRKFSVSSGQSRPRSPFSPVFAPARSPSMSSEYSNADRLYPRQSQNFSRPMSPRPRQSNEQSRSLAPESPRLRPSFDNISINDSIDSPMFPPSHSMESEDISATVGSNGASSYIYTKYALPRGRRVSRASMSAQDFLNNKFDWEQQQQPPQQQQSEIDTGTSPSPDAARESATDSSSGPIGPTTQSPSKGEATRSTLESKPRAPRFREALDDLGPAPPSESKLPQVESAKSNDVHAQLLASVPLDRNAPSRPKTSASSTGKLLRSHKSNPSFPPANLPTLNPFRQPLHGSTLSKDDNMIIPALEASKVRDQLQKTVMPSSDQVSAEEHLTKGIACHENGELQKSTYHLRVAARAGHPTAMLLYALAARHGWGMRPNQAEGVAWLRKAVDSSGIEVAADDETPFKSASRLLGPDVESNAKGAADGPLEAIARRSHKAQLALSIYELGVSYMNGWGVAQDKALALRCFEIAGGWGDGDAMAEAGFCYAKGVGCKKDMVKAAALYRASEGKGISMAGNSWIYKEKYMPRAGATDASRSAAGLGASPQDDDSGQRKGRATSRKDDVDGKKEKKARDKSRTRTIFGGRKKETVRPAGERADLD